MRDSIFDFVQNVSKKTEFLNIEKERVLIIKAQRGDSKSFEQLFCANSRFILKVSNEFSQSYGLPLEDVFSAACEGYIKAIERFDLHKKNRLIIFSIWWIQNAIQDELYRSHAIKIPHNKLNLLKIKNSENCDDLKNVALLNACGNIASLDETFGDEENSGCLYDSIPSSFPNPEKVLEFNEMQNTIESVMKATLNEREIYVLRMAFGFIDGEQHSLSEIGNLLGCSKQRAEQIKKAALIKLRHPNVSYRLKDFVA